jgi:hypothetical protein
MGYRGARRLSGSGLRRRARSAGSANGAKAGPCGKRRGGDKRSHRIEAYSDLIPIAIEQQVDITLIELAEVLRQEHGAVFATSTIWPTHDRHCTTFMGALRLTGMTAPMVLDGPMTRECFLA